jgi:hypothetical protein
MSTGNVLYLLMTIGTFVVFAAVLGFQSWQQSRRGPDVVPLPGPVNRHHQPHGALHA